MSGYVEGLGLRPGLAGENAAAVWREAGAPPTPAAPGVVAKAAASMGIPSNGCGRGYAREEQF